MRTIYAALLALVLALPAHADTYKMTCTVYGVQKSLRSSKTMGGPITASMTVNEDLGTHFVFKSAVEGLASGSVHGPGYDTDRKTIAADLSATKTWHLTSFTVTSDSAVHNEMTLDRKTGEIWYASHVSRTGGERSETSFQGSCSSGL